MNKHQCKYNRHKEICNDLNALYEFKNERYGNSFGNTFQDLGPVSALTRISDKFNRLKELVKDPNMSPGDETILDTLADMANYCIMTMIELEEQADNEEAEMYMKYGPSHHCDVTMNPEPAVSIQSEEKRPLNTYELAQNTNSLKQCALCRYNMPNSNSRHHVCYNCYEFSQFERLK